MQNGSTQVNANEINNMPLPSIERIRRIGSMVKKSRKDDKDAIERLIAKELDIYEEPLGLYWN
jgi:hypothetical protein